MLYFILFSIIVAIAFIVYKAIRSAHTMDITIRPEQLNPLDLQDRLDMLQLLVKSKKSTKV